MEEKTKCSAQVCLVPTGGAEDGSYNKEESWKMAVRENRAVMIEDQNHCKGKKQQK